ncbi:uncharacterized protein N7496_007849 [Penicillium cataractarum]|uniref:Uncharacterized protein n=1 Tax=Penicillium cataractarum TaxID=2100454 RepID=A0A9W9RZU9_9EURO|nr:uncharacterized protein N7496_007849 [Penicillium cataractarum]KAJ5368089.1 hypothetical protein N7496_007849 [Penicillium cataractarum]
MPESIADYAKRLLAVGSDADTSLCPVNLQYTRRDLVDDDTGSEGVFNAATDGLSPAGRHRQAKLAIWVLSRTLPGGRPP